MKEILRTDIDQGDEADIEERVKISAQSSFSDSGLGGNNSDTEDIERGKRRNLKKFSLCLGK